MRRLLKSMVYAEGVNPSVISTEYYIIDNNFQLPIVALGINPSDFPWEMMNTVLK